MIDYQNITPEELEEKVEFIDWSLVPIHVITEDIVDKFGLLPKVKLRLWFEDVLSKLVIKEDKENYHSFIFFFIEDKWYMNLILKNGELWCSYDKIWSVFEKEYSKEYSNIQLYIKNVVEQHFKNMEVTLLPCSVVVDTLVEQHFKNREVTPHPRSGTFNEEVEQHFKNRVSIDS